jgi:hypothetical protein
METEGEVKGSCGSKETRTGKVQREVSEGRKTGSNKEKRKRKSGSPEPSRCLSFHPFPLTFCRRSSS